MTKIESLISEFAKKSGFKINEDGLVCIGNETLDLSYLIKDIAMECSHIAAVTSLNRIAIHPDIGYEDMTESAKTINHLTCHTVSREIRKKFDINET